MAAADGLPGEEPAVRARCLLGVALRGFATSTGKVIYVNHIQPAQERVDAVQYCACAAKLRRQESSVQELWLSGSYQRCMRPPLRSL